MKLTFTLVLAFVAVAAFGADPVLPNQALTPGSIRVDTAEGLLAVKSTKTIRNVPERERQAVFQRYGISYDKAHNYEVDHLLSLELGGDNSISNLWPQSYITLPYNAHTKDKLENWLARDVKRTAATNLPLATVKLRGYQGWICTNWVSAYEALVEKGAK